MLAAPLRRLIAVGVFMIANRPSTPRRLASSAAAHRRAVVLSRPLFGALFCQPVEIADDFPAGQIKRLNVAVLLDELHDIIVRCERRDGERLRGAGLHWFVAV